MSNMSYCRFENTVTDLNDCYNHMHDLDLSSDEEAKKKELIDLCKEIACDFEDEEDEEN